ncbi:MAG TPA: calcium-binding EGF-like domain-containing protein, partial [Polyangiaceae bacterium]|nr:calcium-binding EGF-like domain-containing protein [Polyangiaceae bacterium]
MRFGFLFALAMVCASCSSSTTPAGGERSAGGSSGQGGGSSEGGSISAGAAGLAGGAAPVLSHDCSDGAVKCAAHATCIPSGLQYDCVCDDGYTGDGVSSCTTPVQTPVCGDKICQATESCTTCSADCGACMPSCAGLDPGTQCTVLPSCGCAAGSMCIPTTTSGSGRCVPAGTAREGYACATNSDCASGLGCTTTLWGQTIHVCGQIVADAMMSTCNAGTLGIDGTANEVSGLAVC